MVRLKFDDLLELSRITHFTMCTTPQTNASQESLSQRIGINRLFNILKKYIIYIHKNLPK